MNEEIKTILESLGKIAKAEYYPEDLLTYKECQLLLDYITNLQEENQRLKELCDKYEEEHDNEFKRWQKDIKANKKAIEYIWSTKYEWGDLDQDNEDFDIDAYKLINILGGDEE